MPARDAVIVDAVRTPVGKKNGSLSGWHAADLSAHVLRALADRTGLDPAAVDDVVWGCVQQVGQQSYNVGRMAVLAAGWPESVPAVTLDRQCGSSQQSVHFAAAGLVSGQYEVAVAGGVEIMSGVPLGASYASGEFGLPGGPLVAQRYDGVQFSQGAGAEIMVEKWGLSRQQLDEFAAGSHARLAAAIDSGRLSGQITPVGEFAVDEGLRRGTSVETLAALKPSFKPDGTIHAGNASQISDGAAALLMTTSAKAAELGLTPIARVHTAVLAGDDPVMMLDRRRSRLRRKALSRVGLSIRRHRCVRGERGVRAGAAGLAGRDRRRPGPAQPARRRDRARPPARRVRRPAADHAGTPPARRRRPLRAADHVRGRRHGQRDGLSSGSEPGR